ncbi:ankyrin repeat-containing domain protein [Morchella snyderi]|nr:ankyrin repeat-containing domain protein [Morchella snyderi]
MSKSDIISGIPNELLFLVVKACQCPEDVASLSFTNHFFYDLLYEHVNAGIAGYVAIESVDIQIIMRTIRLNGPRAIILGLQHYHSVKNAYSLQAVVAAHDLAVFNLISPYLTRGHECLEPVLEMMCSERRPQMLTLLTPYLNQEQLHYGFLCAVEGNIISIADPLYRLIGRTSRRHACNESLLQVVTSNLKEVRRLVIQGCSDVSRNKHRLLHFVVSVGPQSAYKYSAVDMHETVQLLCAGGINVNQENESGHTPLHLLARFGPEKIGGSGDRGILCFAAAHISCVKIILRSGVKINQIDMKGRTVLWYAVRYGETAMVHKLLEAGADMGVLDIDNTRADQIPDGSTRNVVVAAAMVVAHMKKVKEAIRMGELAEEARRQEGRHK